MDEREWVIAVDSAYAFRDERGLWSIWSDPTRASTWLDEFAARDAMDRAPAGIRHNGVVRRRPTDSWFAAFRKGNLA